MVAKRHMTIRHTPPSFEYVDACALAHDLRQADLPALFTIDLSQTTRTSTAALARLILLRRNLLIRGGDIRLTGLHGQPIALYRFHRMTRLLPLAGGEDDQTPPSASDAAWG